MLSRSIYNTASVLRTDLDQDRTIGVLAQRQMVEVMFHWQDMAIALEAENERLKADLNARLHADLAALAAEPNVTVNDRGGLPSSVRTRPILVINNDAIRPEGDGS